MASIQVTLEDHHGNIIHRAKIADGAEGSRLLPALVTTLRLPIIDIWKTATGQLSRTLLCYTTSLAWAPSGKTLVSEDYQGRTIKFWDIEIGLNTATLLPTDTNTNIFDTQLLISSSRFSYIERKGYTYLANLATDGLHILAMTLTDSQ